MSAAALTAAQRRRLRAEAHPLHPIAQVGKQGISPQFLAEVDRALESHELIKIRVRGARAEREEQVAQIARELACLPVSTVGYVAVLYRRNEEGAEPPREPMPEPVEEPT